MKVNSPGTYNNKYFTFGIIVIGCTLGSNNWRGRFFGIILYRVCSLIIMNMTLQYEINPVFIK